MAATGQITVRNPATGWKFEVTGGLLAGKVGTGCYHYYWGCYAGAPYA